jgi:hypothetical protein
MNPSEGWDLGEFRDHNLPIIQRILGEPTFMYLLLEGYHRLEWAQRSGMTQVPMHLISPWKEGQKLSMEELLQLKQLRNFTESNRQNDGIFFSISNSKI